MSRFGITVTAMPDLIAMLRLTNDPGRPGEDVLDEVMPTLHPPRQEATVVRPWRNEQRVSSEALA